MKFTFQCPSCKKKFDLDLKTLTHGGLRCCMCGTEPAPDIMTAYQNVGKTMAELYECCEEQEQPEWLPTKVEKVEK